ncbi:MAG TPA: hypothetical protein VIY27_02040 [Myxococcota bacterium]
MPPIVGPDKAPPASGYVGDTTIGGKAAQYFTIPRGALRDNVVLSWGCTQVYSCYSIYSSRYTELNGRGHFRPGNPHAATMTTTLRFATTMSSVSPPLGAGAPRTPTTTFPYFRWNHYTSGGAPTPSATYRARGNYDFKRAGSIRIWPGSRRFGGTMRWLYGENGFWYRVITDNWPWLTREFFPATQWQREDTLTQVLGERASVGYGYRVRYTSSGDVHATTPVYGATVHTKAQYIETAMPWTTGKVRVYQPLGSYGATTLTFSGYDNRTVAGFLGRISLVRARLRHSCENPSDVSQPIRDFRHAGRVDRFDVMFLGQAPEPRSLLLLGTGIATLASLARARLRRR